LLYFSSFPAHVVALQTKEAFGFVPKYDFESADYFWVILYKPSMTVVSKCGKKLPHRTKNRINYARHATFGTA
jgi:hypothetical protein